MEKYAGMAKGGILFVAVMVIALLLYGQIGETSVQGECSLLAIMAILLIVIYQLACSLSSTRKELRSLSADRVRMVARMKTMITAPKDAVVAINSEGLITIFNPAAEEMFGLTAAEATGNPVEILMPEELRKKHLEAVKNFFAGKGQRKAIDATLELTALRANGERFPVELSLSFGELDDPFVLAIIRDIAKRKEREEGAIAAQKLEALGTMAAGIAHEFNNRLTVILAGLGGLPRDGVMEEFLEDLEMMEDSVIKAHKLAQRIILLSNGKKEAKKLTSLDGVVKGALVFIRSSIPKSIQIEIKGECTSPIMANHGQLEQVLINLCINASHAIGENNGQVDIIMGTAGIDDPKLVQLVIRDNGRGMTEDIRRRVFDPYFTTKGGKGSGLGLAIAQRIIHDHGGTITVESTLGDGTAFTILLPVLNHGDSTAT